jgi:hypothetical protein
MRPRLTTTKRLKMLKRLKTTRLLLLTMTERQVQLLQRMIGQQPRGTIELEPAALDSRRRRLVFAV